MAAGGDRPDLASAKVDEVDEVGATGLMTAAIRADESARPDRMFDDPFAAHFAGARGRELLAELDEDDAPVPATADEHIVPDGPAVPDGPVRVPSGQVTRAFVALRTRFMDETLRAAVEAEPGTQVVILAAGMDARAYRHEWLAGVPVYELDRPAVLAYKQRVLDGLGVAPHAERRPVGADLAHAWPALLTRAGFAPGRPSVWLAEGLLCYLEPGQARALLAGVEAMAAPGSRLAVDVINADMLAVPETQEMLLRYEKWGCPWQFGTNEPAELLAGYGFTADVHRPGVPPYDHQRWPLPVAPPGIPNVPRSFYLDAVRNGQTG